MKLPIALLLLYLASVACFAQQVEKEILYFNYGKGALTANSKMAIDNLLQHIEIKNIKQVELSGHTDSDGSDSYNLMLSKQRVAIVQQYLAVKGITSEKIKSTYYGKNQPIASNETVDGKQKNRRVEITLLPLADYAAKINNNVAFKQPSATLPCASVLQLTQRQILYFNYGKHELTATSKQIIHGLLEKLSNYTIVQIDLSGHTDGDGGIEFNLKLSQERVAIVQHYIAEKGVDDRRLMGSYFGKSQPIASNETESGKQKNRRVEMIIKFNDCVPALPENKIDPVAEKVLNQSSGISVTETNMKEESKAPSAIYNTISPLETKPNSRTEKNIPVVSNTTVSNTPETQSNTNSNSSLVADKTANTTVASTENSTPIITPAHDETMMPLEQLQEQQPLEQKESTASTGLKNPISSETALRTTNTAETLPASVVESNEISLSTETQSSPKDLPIKNTIPIQETPQVSGTAIIGTDAVSNTDGQPVTSDSSQKIITTDNQTQEETLQIVPLNVTPEEPNVSTTSLASIAAKNESEKKITPELSADLTPTNHNEGIPTVYEEKTVPVIITSDSTNQQPIPSGQSSYSNTSVATEIQPNYVEVSEEKIMHLDITIVHPEFDDIDSASTKIPDSELNQEQHGGVQTFTVSAKDEFTVKGENGTTVTFPKNSLVDKSGQPVRDDVTVSLQEVYTKTDMINSNIQTTSDGKLLESGGMANVTVASNTNSEEVYLNKNSAYEITYPTQTKKEDMQLFYGEHTKSNVNWVTEKNPDDSTFNENKNSLDNYVFKSSKLGWTNVDRFVGMNDKDKTNLRVNPGENNDTNICLVFKRLNSVLNITNKKDDYMFSHIPVGEEATLVAFSRKGNALFYASKAITIDRDKTEKIVLERLTEAEFQERIKEFN